MTSTHAETHEHLELLERGLLGEDKAGYMSQLRKYLGQVASGRRIYMYLTFSLPVAWTLRPPLVDEKLAVLRVHTRHATMLVKERILSQLPPSMTKAL